MREIERATEAETNLVADAHQQKEREQLVGRAHVMHREQPHDDVDVQEEQRQVEAAGAVVERAHGHERDQPIADVDRRQREEVSEREDRQVEIVQKAPPASSPGNR